MQACLEHFQASEEGHHGLPILPTADSKHVDLYDLPDSISNLHMGLSLKLLSAPVRFVKVHSLLSWSSLKVFEEVDEALECMVKPYKAVAEDEWAQLVCVSWRWAAAKPSYQQPSFSPMSSPQFAYLRHVLSRALELGMQYVWIDWCCAPQYRDDPITEIMRSKV